MSASDVIAPATSSSAAMPSGELVGEELDLGRTDVGGEEEGQPELREREALGEPRALLGLAPREPGAERRRPRERVELARRRA